MAPRVRTATGFRWRPTSLEATASDFVRVLQDGSCTLALLSNGHDGAFSTCWPPGSRLMLDLFVGAWRGTSGPAGERLAAAFSLARERYTEQARAMTTPDPYFPDQHANAVLLAVVLKGSTAHVAWIGNDVGLVARDTCVIFQTTPHTLVEKFRREHPEVTDLSKVPNVVLRTIGPSATDAEPPDALTTTIAAGDTLILLSQSFPSPFVTTDEAAAAAARGADPSALAAQLADAEFRHTKAAYAAVAVVRMEASPFTRESE